MHGLFARETFGRSCLFPILSDLFLKHLFQKHRDLTLPRWPDVGGGKDHDQRIGSGEDEEILRESEAIDKIAHGRACDERCEAEAHDGQPRRKAAMPGKPFHKRRDRRDIARAKTNAPDGSVEEIEQESGLTVNRRRCPKETRTEKDGRDHPAPGRPSRSTRGPKKPAESPRNRIAIEKAQVVAESESPIVSITGRVRTLHAYTLPIDMWIPTAAMAVSQRFLFIKKSLHF